MIPMPKTIEIKCTKCKVYKKIEGVTEQMIQDWRSGTLIQVAMPHLTRDERELLISGTCGKCFDKAFHN